MKDEIKEIINDLQRVADRKCYPEDILDGSIAQEWVDYITNLQKENKHLNLQLDKALDYTKGFINGKTSRIDEWKNVELVLETIVEILGDKE